MTLDLDYYTSRALEELERAAAASSAAAAAIHRELAAKYDAMVREAKGKPMMLPALDDASDAQFAGASLLSERQIA